MASPSTEKASSLEEPVSGNGALANGGQVFMLGLGLMLFAMLAAYLLASVWPAEFTPTTEGGKSMPFALLGTTDKFDVTADVRLLLVVMATGALGTFVHTATSFSDFVGNEKLGKSWLWWYVLKPFIGMALALIFYLVVRAGFLSSGTEAGKLNIYGIAALSGLAGMFSKQATDKLSEVFTTLFRTAPGAGDAKRKDDLSNAVPTLSDVVPRNVETGSSALTLEVKGANFVKSSVVRVGGTARDTEYKDESRLLAALVPDDIAQAGQLAIEVFSPAPGGGTSTPMIVKVGSAGPGATSNDEHLDGCDVEVTSITSDRELPAAQGGVAAS